MKVCDKLLEPLEKLDIGQTYLFSIPKNCKRELIKKKLPDALRDAFEKHKRPLTEDAKISTIVKGRWQLVDGWKRYIIKPHGRRIRVYELIYDDFCVDLYSKKLKLLDHIKLLVAYVALQCHGLRELSEASKRHDVLTPISYAQLSKVHKNRNYEVFVMIFYLLLNHSSNYRKYWKLRLFIGKKLLGIDSTFVRIKGLLKLSQKCLPLRDKEKGGIKIHVAALLGALVQPLSAVVTPKNVHDTIEFDELLSDVSLFELLNDIILLLDKGYTDYERYRKLMAQGIQFVVQLKKNAVYEVLSSKDYAHYIEQIILLDGMKLRLVKYQDYREWRFLTNVPADELSADEIRDAYRLRWMIEMFFRELKHAVKITHFYTKTVNGVMIQIFATLTAYTLINIFRISENRTWTSVEYLIKSLKHTFDKTLGCLFDPG